MNEKAEIANKGEQKIKLKLLGLAQKKKNLDMKTLAHFKNFFLILFSFLNFTEDIFMHQQHDPLHGSQLHGDKGAQVAQ